MLLLINHRYPVLGSVLSALSSVVFSVAGIALSVVQFTYRRRHHTAAAKQ
jgi:hypothetical protein